MIRKHNKWLRLLNKYLKSARKGTFRQSNALTLITRPLWQHDKVKAMVGAPLLAALIMGTQTSPMNMTDSLTNWNISSPTSEIPGFTTTISTDHTYLLPVRSLTGISQYFHAGHPGIDFRAPLGSDVVSMDNGKVSAIYSSEFGYGRHVYVVDKDGKEVLYAHLGKISVEIGEEVEAGAKIGEIGMTGWTTGPHLHFEVREDGIKTNPIPLVSKAISEYQKSAKIAVSR